MRLLFICPTLEPGKCGVGDFTHRLAEACGRQNVECAILALNDPFLPSTGSRSTSGHSGQTQYLRLSRTLSWTVRHSLSSEFIDKVAPNWASVQFVPYSYHPKGLPLALPRRLQRLLRTIEGRHIFFHELWVEANSQWKRRIVASLQKMLIRRLIHRLSPQRVATSNPRYAECLKAFHSPIHVHPIFSNIPRSPCLLSTPASSESNKPIRCLHFGKVIPEDFPLEAVVGFLEQMHGGENEVEVRFVGETRGGSKIVNRLESRLPQKISVSQSGWLDMESVSQELHRADLALVSTPASLIQKSGTVAAIRQHELPFVLFRNDLVDSPDLLPAILGQEGHLPEEWDGDGYAWKNKIPRKEPNQDVDAFAMAFLNSLHA